MKINRGIKKRGKNIYLDYELDFKESVVLTEGQNNHCYIKKTIDYVRNVECSVCKGSGLKVHAMDYDDICRSCNGKGRVKFNEKLELEIPRGIKNQSQVEFKGFGD